MKVQYLQGLHTVSGIYTAAHLAATATEKLALFEAPFDCFVKRVSFSPQDAVTGNTTNHTNFNLLDGGADGSGTTEIANKDLDTGTDLVALDYQDVFLTTAAEHELSAGDVLVLQLEKVGAGVLIPQGNWLVSVEAKGS